jgi:hypothetical protein
MRPGAESGSRVVFDGTLAAPQRASEGRTQLSVVKIAVYRARHDRHQGNPSIGKSGVVRKAPKTTVPMVHPA